MKTLDEILRELIYAQAGDASGTMPIELLSLGVAKSDILKLIPKKKELDDCGIVKEVCYGYNQAQKGFNACIDEMEKKFK